MEIVWEAIKLIWSLFFDHLMFWNFLFAVIIVFFERKDPKSVWAWLLLLYFIPILGFIFYLFLGQDYRRKKMFRIKELEDQLNDAIRQQENYLRTQKPEDVDADIKDYRDLIMYNLATGGNMLTGDNDIDFFTDGKEKFAALAEDLRNAKHFIHIQYYIIRDDVLFQQIKEILIEKVKQGVEVRILFDAMGCRRAGGKFWKALKEEGIQIAEFFPALFGRFQLRINFRNHRKSVVIDNEIAYVGGFNIGKEYIGLDEKFGYWRDTHMRIRGSAVWDLHIRFIMDWNYASRENLIQNQKVLKLPEPGVRDFCEVQIISSGPDNSAQMIHDNYLRMIAKAEKSIFIQTPYFIPDEAIYNALMIAIRSGVEVNIMIPCKPDHMFVYWATYSYIGDMVLAGAKCYTYENGFLHSKVMIIDGKVVCCGTANMDIRSFALNFEVNAIVYDRKKAQEMEEIFQDDLKHCKHITKDFYMGRSVIIRLKEQVCRLLSPLL